MSTPGPWRADASNFRFAINTDAFHIAMVNIMGMPISEARANALLIAAAPELLEALEAAPPLPSGEMSVGELLHQYRKWYNGVRQATIAKARGE